LKCGSLLAQRLRHNTLSWPGHSRPKDGVLSHAYVPAIHVLFAGKKRMDVRHNNPFVPANAGTQSKFRLVAGSPLELAPVKAGAGMNGNARFGGPASKCAGKLDIFGLAPDELGGRFSRGRSVMTPARFGFSLAVGPRGRALQFHEQRRIAQTSGKLRCAVRRRMQNIGERTEARKEDKEDKNLAHVDFKNFCQHSREHNLNART
jgi:hypothetical protein